MDHVGLHDPCRYWLWGTDIEDHHVDPVRVDGRGWQYPVVGRVTSYEEEAPNRYVIRYQMTDGTTGESWAIGTGRTGIGTADNGWPL